MTYDLSDLGLALLAGFFIGVGWGAYLGAVVL